jgi:MYXO-CTERM domain-containing protein
MKGSLLQIGSSALIATVLLAPGSVLAYGEGDGDGPSMEERAVHLFTDRLRVEPDATDAEFSNYPPVAPLIYNVDLGEAARFHGDDMAESGCFQHESCDGTEFGTRLNRFYSGFAIGENIAMGSPNAESVVFEGWLYSPPHRDNMLRAEWRELGTGYAQDESSVPFWVQDFGSRGGEVEPITTSATHWPLYPTVEANLRFYLAVYDPEGEPEEAELFWRGELQTMDSDRGSDGQQTYFLDVSSGPETCQSYYFKLTRSDGSSVLYPSAGALQVPVGESECTSWVDSRDTQSTAGCGSGERSEDFSGQGCQSDPDADGAPGENLSEEDSYASCTVAAGSPGGGWLLLTVLALQRRRRRR